MNFDDMKANMGSGKALANQSTIAAKKTYYHSLVV